MNYVPKVFPSRPSREASSRLNLCFPGIKRPTIITQSIDIAASKQHPPPQQEQRFKRDLRRGND